MDLVELFGFLAYIPYLDTILELLLAAHALALAIVNMTETPKDDEWVGKIYRWIEFLAGIVNKAKVKQ